MRWRPKISVPAEGGNDHDSIVVVTSGWVDSCNVPIDVLSFMSPESVEFSFTALM